LVAVTFLDESLLISEALCLAASTYPRTAPRSSLSGLAKGQGALKKKVTDPYVVGWFLGGQKSTRASPIFPRDFYIVFLNSPHRETPKNVIKIVLKKIGFGFFLSIWL
jgi:hypothetical protein